MKKLKKPILHFLALLNILIFINACKKQDFTTTISGQVLEYGSNSPVVGAIVYVYGGESDGNISNPGLLLETIDSMTTDDNGFYHFRFDAEPYHVLEMDARHIDYFPITAWTQNVFRTKNNEIDIVLDPHAWLELHLKNINPVNDSDNISVGNTFGFGNINPIYGVEVDTTILGLVKGNNQDLKAIWFVTKAGNTQNFNAPIYCSAHDTTRFEILY